MGLCVEAARKLSWRSERLGDGRASRQAPNRALKLFASVPALLRAHSRIATASLFSKYKGKATKNHGTKSERVTATLSARRTGAGRPVAPSGRARSDMVGAAGRGAALGVPGAT